MISIVMPVYKLGKKVRYSIKAVELVMTKFFNKELFEVIVVDDGSPDDTYLNALSEAKHYDNVIVMRLPRNFGKAVALFAGFYRSRGKYIVFFDGDLDIDPRQILLLLATLHKSNVEIVITSKWHPKSKIIATPIRKFLSKAFNMLERALLGINLRDTQTGAKAFKRCVLEELAKIIIVKRYAFDAELLAYAHRLGYEITEAPAVWCIKLTSKFRFREILQMFLDLLAIRYRLSRIKPKVKK